MRDRDIIHRRLGEEEERGRGREGRETECRAKALHTPDFLAGPVPAVFLSH